MGFRFRSVGKGTSLKVETSCGGEKIVEIMISDFEGVRLHHLNQAEAYDLLMRLSAYLPDRRRGDRRKG